MDAFAQIHLTICTIFSLIYTYGCFMLIEKLGWTANRLCLCSTSGFCFDTAVTLVHDIYEFCIL